MQGKNWDAMRSGCVLWLIVKCCPGAIARLHLTACTAESNQWLLLRVSWGRPRSWLIFSGSLKMSKRAGFHWSGAQVRGNALQHLEWKLLLSSTQMQLYFYWFNFACVEKTRRVTSASAAWDFLIGMTNGEHLHTSFIWYVNCKLLHEAVDYSQILNPSGYTECLQAQPEDTHTHT